MNTAAAIILLLSNNGHWFGGQSNTIRIQWAMESPPKQVVLQWQLRIANAQLSSGSLTLPSDGQDAVLSLAPPRVRAQTQLRWTYQLRSTTDKTVLAEGERRIELYPADLLKDASKLTAGKRIIVWDRPEGLPKLLQAVDVAFERVSDGPELQLKSADIVLVGHDRIEGGPFDQTELLAQAQSGASVMLFRQPRPAMLASYRLEPRRPPARLEWRRDHPLLQGLPLETLQSWLGDHKQELQAIELPPDEPALEVAYWPREVPAEQPAPIDALLVTKSLSNGRIVLCQIPLGPWESDPRSQLLLVRALDYLRTRPEPTPPPSRRPVERPVQPTSVPTITIPPGGRP